MVIPNLIKFMLIVACSSIKTKGDKFLQPIQRNTDLNLCLQLITSQYFQRDDFIIIFNPNDKLTFYYSSNVPVIIQSFQNVKEFQYKLTDSYIINVDDVDEFVKIIQIISVQETFNPRARTVVIIQQITPQLFTILNKMLIRNVVILENRLFNIYTYFPYEMEDFNRPQTAPKWINRCINGKLQNDNKLFPEKLPKLWRNSTLHVGYLLLEPFVICLNCDTIMPGFEIDVMNVLQSILKFNVNYIEYTSRGLKENDEYTDAFQDIHENRIGTCLGTFKARELEYVDFDMSFTFSEEELYWVVKKLDPMQYWERIVNIFEPNFWLMLLLCWFAVAICTNFFSKFGNSRKIPFIDAFVKTVQMFLYQCATNLPKNTQFRVMAIGWFMLAIIFNTVFNAKLFQVLSGEIDEQIETMEQIMDEQYVPLLPDWLTELFYFDSDEDRYISENYDVCDPVDVCMNITAQNYGIATLQTVWFPEYVIPRNYVDNNRKELLYISNYDGDAVLTYLISWYYRKGFPLKEQFDDLLLGLRDNGFIFEKYDMYDYFNLLAKGRLESTLDFVQKPLNLNQLQGAFYLLFVGYSVSSISFCLEIVYFHFLR